MKENLEFTFVTYQLNQISQTSFLYLGWIQDLAEHQA